MPSVSIGKRFLSEVRSQYEDWHAGYAREAFQNCADAPRVKNVSFRTEEVGGNTIVEFENDGAPMTREIMEGKLLTLGESGKEHHGTVGGFGRAKELLYFCHEEFEIWSGSIYVNGSGCEYEINLDSEPLKGTKSRVVIEGYHAEELNRAFRKCISYSMFKGSVTLNGEVIEDRTNRGKKRDWGGAGEWCRVYTNRKHENLLLVRVGGIFMYSKRIWDYKGCVVVELLTSRETLTSNRDSLKWEYREAIDSFIEDISTNKRKAFRPKAPKFHRFEGTKLSADLTKEAFTLDTDAMEKNSPEA